MGSAGLFLTARPRIVAPGRPLGLNLQATVGRWTDMAASPGSVLAAVAVPVTVVLALGSAGMPLLPVPSERAPEREEVAALRADLARLSAEYGELRDRQEQLSVGFAHADARMEQGLHRLEVLDASLDPDFAASSAAEMREALRNDVLRPVFQIVGDEAVGSGVLVQRGRDERGPYYLALSCYHVLRDIVAEAPKAQLADFRFRLDFDQLEDAPRDVRARLLFEDEARDLALLRIDTPRDLGPVARIAPLARAENVQPFTPVYTVGCPLGTGVQATLGEVTRSNWTVDGQPYWMVSSPAYFGNSGGGVFLAESHELAGIFSKIYTHGSYRPQVVTHMGLAVPLPALHAWLSEIGHGSLLPSEPR